jgi:hypothetical protein
MVDPRIYRALLVLVAFAVIVFGFSLQSQPGGVSTTLAPGQFFGSTYGTMTTLAKGHANRTPGSPSDNRLAAYVKNDLITNAKGFQVSTQQFTTHTSSGQQVLTNVLATRAGLGNGEIVVVAHRDTRPHAGQAVADMSGTVVLLELASALSGETLNGRSVLLVSTSGQVGAAGATELAHSLSSQSVDAVIVLGDLAGARHHNPVVVTWSGSDLLAPPMLRNTVAGYVRQEAGIRTPQTGLAGQFVRLAFPFSVTEQSPFIESGLPAVLLSVDGDTVTPAHAPFVPSTSNQVANLGSAVLQTVNALDQGPAVPAPSSYLVIDGKIVPLWALRLLVLALILPVAATAVDALARTRRRGHSILRWLGWVLCGALPFLVALAALLLVRVANLLSVSLPGAVGAGVVPITGGDVAVLVAVLVLMVLAFVFLRPLALRAVASLYGQSGPVSRPAAGPDSPAADAAAVALTLVMCVITLVLWSLNPFAALFLVPALHLWLWLAQPGVRSHRWGVLTLTLLAVLPAVPVVIYYANAYGLTPLALIWSGALMISGGAMPVALAACWALALGCLSSALLIAARSVRSAASAADAPVTVRGPATYAGPGSLGGTKSALRR